ncbi:hypothetical protein [Mycoplasma sp. E35C]|uniref:hypothetical protein n=1 Tax=Mycoplasma sp. E35C TaxID=2801918 RepID=UPI001CA4202D|nr:hypothetical protein [Mycoplasma sp. E35C]QZX49307.1 hypothetical protein JJE79_00950 [Mycoplasma sp. E35C]
MTNYKELRKLAIIRIIVSLLIYISFFVGLIMTVLGVKYYLDFKQAPDDRALKKLAHYLMDPGVMILVFFVGLLIYYIYLVKYKLKKVISSDDKLSEEQKNQLYFTSGFIHLPYILNDIHFFNMVSSYKE